MKKNSGGKSFELMLRSKVLKPSNKGKKIPRF
jgi:hypothetical protein